MQYHSDHVINLDLSKFDQVSNTLHDNNFAEDADFEQPEATSVSNNQLSRLTGRNKEV